MIYSHSAAKFNMTNLPLLPETIISCLDAQGGHSDNAESKHNFRRPRTIVLCLDGTGDLYDEDNSNIVKLFASLRKDIPEQVSIIAFALCNRADVFFPSLPTTNQALVRTTIRTPVSLRCGGAKLLT